MPEAITPLTYSPAQAAKRIGLGVSTILSLIHSKKLKALRLGNRFRVPAVAIDNFLGSLPEVQS